MSDGWFDAMGIGKRSILEMRMEPPVVNPQKRKGSKWELDVARFLSENGCPHAERSRAGWRDDRGDIDGLPGVVIECKDHKKHDLAGWVDETERERANAWAAYGITVVKRKAKPPSDAYAVLPLRQLVQLLVEAGYGTKENP